MSGKLSKTARASTRGKRVAEGKHVVIADPETSVTRIKLVNYDLAGDGTRFNGMAWMDDDGKIYANAKVRYVQGA